MADAFAIAESHQEILKRIEWLCQNNITEAQFRERYDTGKNYAGWILDQKIKLIPEEENIREISYRPFDNRFTYYDNKVIWRWRENIMRHYIKGPNIGLLCSKAHRDKEFSHIFLTNKISEVIFLSGQTASNAVNFPLYIYNDDFGSIEKKDANLNSVIYKKIKENVSNVTPERVFDYIYAVLHSPAYRVRYAEFLKSDFPRIPYPHDSETFHALADKGAALRSIHLMENQIPEKPTTTYPVDGNHEVIKPHFENGKVWINVTQYFGNVPEIAWNFYIGGYQPAQKWLKDRKGHNLTIDDIRHYQRIIVALTETDKIMKEIDEIDFLPKSE